jgi:hypothetical protein
MAGWRPLMMAPACAGMCRHAWHMSDHVPVLRRLRWGQVPYANLRFRNGPHDRLGRAYLHISAGTMHACRMPTPCHHCAGSLHMTCGGGLHVWQHMRPQICRGSGQSS